GRPRSPAGRWPHRAGRADGRRAHRQRAEGERANRERPPPRGGRLTAREVETMVQAEGTQRLAREQAYEYDMVAKAPTLAVGPRQVFPLETEDGHNGLRRSEDLLPVPEVLGPRSRRWEGNACAGPIVVEGAPAGDVLVVEIRDIVVDHQGTTCIFRG